MATAESADVGVGDEERRIVAAMDPAEVAARIAYLRADSLACLARGYSLTRCRESLASQAAALVDPEHMPDDLAARINLMTFATRMLELAIALQVPTNPTLKVLRPPAMNAPRPPRKARPKLAVYRGD